MPDLQVLPVPAEQSEVVGHGREGRLPRIVRYHRGQRDKDHGYCDLAGTLAQEGNMPCTQESRKTCLPGDTSFMQLERKRNVRQARPAGRRTSEWQTGTGPRMWWKRSGVRSWGFSKMGSEELGRNRIPKRDPRDSLVTTDPNAQTVDVPPFCDGLSCRGTVGEGGGGQSASQLLELLCRHGRQFDHMNTRSRDVAQLMLTFSQAREAQLLCKLHRRVRGHTDPSTVRHTLYACATLNL